MIDDALLHELKKMVATAASATAIPQRGIQAGLVAIATVMIAGLDVLTDIHTSLEEIRDELKVVGR